jgi:hypothetical protein
LNGDERDERTAFPVKTRGYAWLGLVVATFAVDAAYGEQPCNKEVYPYSRDWMIAKEPRAYFYSGPANASSAPKRLKGFVVRGDLVIARGSDADLVNGAFSLASEYVCGLYYGTAGAETYGWLRKSDLLTLVDHGNLYRYRDDPTLLPSELSELLSRLPAVKSWPSVGVTPDPCYHDGFIGDSVCVHPVDLDKRKLCLTTTHRFDHVECGELSLGNRCAKFETEGWYEAYLFNNAIAIVSQGDVWGNHGQSDPQGVYVFSSSADRACPSQIESPLPR